MNTHKNNEESYVDSSKKQRPFITMDEACEYLGLSKATLYGYTSKNIIPYYKLQNRRIYFKIDELNDFILNKKNRVNSKQEIEEEAATEIVKNKRKATRKWEK